jgi:hypothetical protein
MLEIDKIKERFPERAGDILSEYARDFSQLQPKREIPPNPPFAPEPLKDLFDAPLESAPHRDTP